MVLFRHNRFLRGLAPFHSSLVSETLRCLLISSIVYFIDFEISYGCIFFNYTIECPWSYCASYCEEHSRWILDEGNYIVRVGNSSRNTSIAAKIELDKLVILEQLKKVIPSENVEEISLKNIIPYCPPKDEEQLKTAPVIKLSASTFTTKTAESQCKKLLKQNTPLKI